MAAVLTLNMMPYGSIEAAADEVSVQSESQVKQLESYDERVEYVRNALLNRQQTITLKFNTGNVTVVDYINAAMEYRRGAAGCEGDSLRQAVKEYRTSVGYDCDEYMIQYSVKYYTTAEQEAKLTKAVDEALAGLHLDGKTTEQKIRSIYDYICDNVNYDYDGLNDSSNTIKYTAYGALINKKAVCQGYAVLFYRMCVDAGIPARVITGRANGGAHAWNIVEINGYYYNVDATWDGQDEETRHNYYLKCDEDFNTHYRANDYNTDSFKIRFPMTEKSYMNYDALDSAMEKDNPEYTFETLDGLEVSSMAQKRPKLLVFFSNQCTNSMRTIKSMSNADFSDIDVLYLNTNNYGNDEATESFKSEYGNDSMVFSSYSTTNNSASWDYVRQKFGYVTSYTWPIIVYINADNKVEQVTTGVQAAGNIRCYVDYYLYNKKTFELSHNHIYDGAWTKDELTHYHKCVAENCDGTVKDKENHTAGEWIVDRAATTEQVGVRHKECTVCGYVLQTETLDKLAPEPTPSPEPTPAPAQKDDDGIELSTNGWHKVGGVVYWYEGGVRQGYKAKADGSIDDSYRGKEIYDPVSNAWYWLDNVQQGAVAKNKDVYQESLAGDWGERVDENGNRTGKWVRYDSEGHMVKGWQTTENGRYYFDPVYGTMAKGKAVIDGREYYFNEYTGVLEREEATTDDNGIALTQNGWHRVGGVDYWYEDGVRQGYKTKEDGSIDDSYRGKEIYDPASNAWYWLDNVQQGAVARNKDVYQESLAGDWGDRTDENGNRIGKWVRYDADGHMVKGWNEQNGNRYYFDLVYGTMAKGDVVIDGVSYHFDVNTGILQ